MSKKGGGGEFNNYAAKKFRQVENIGLLEQAEIFRVLDQDIDTILEQVTANRNHKGKYPTYVANAFANLSTALWFNIYVSERVKISKKGKMKTELSDDQIESIKTLLAEAFRKSAKGEYAKQTSESQEREKLISETFVMLDPVNYMLAKKLRLIKAVEEEWRGRKKTETFGKKEKNDRKRELDKAEAMTRELVIQVFNNPVTNINFAQRIFNESSVKDKKKLKIFKKMYGDRYDAAIGAAFTVDSNNSDCIAMLYDEFNDRKIKKRAPVVKFYAEAYKRNQSANFRLKTGEFYDRNKKLIKALKVIDIGFKKAFKNLDPTKAKAATKKDNRKNSW